MTGAVSRIPQAKLIHARKYLDIWFQVLPGLESECMKVYRGIEGVAPEVRGLGE